MKEFIKRLLVTVIGVPLAIWLIYAGGIVFFVLVLILSSVTLWEYYRLCKIKGLFPFINAGIISHLLFLVIFYLILTGNVNSMKYEIILAILIFFVLFVLTLALYQKTESIIFSISSTLSGLIYITMPFSAMLLLRNLHLSSEFLKYFELKNMVLTDAGSAGLIMTTFLTVWICDTCAYLLGMAFGRHNLMPSVSPKKTWEGAIGGFLGAVLSFWAASYWLLPGFGVYNALLLGAIIGVIGQIGDLAESKIKRDAAVKDSSNIIPGHGGLLDRFDSILFVIPAVLIYLLFYIQF